MLQKPSRSTSVLRAFLRSAALAGTVSFAMCGVRSWPKPPQMEDGYGARYSDAGVGCDNVEAANVVPVGKTTEEICDACDDLREKRARCGVKEQLGGRCRALCQRPDWKRDQEPEQDIEAKTEAMKRWAKTPPDAGHDEDFLDGGVK